MISIVFLKIFKKHVLKSYIVYLIYRRKKGKVTKDELIYSIMFSSQLSYEIKVSDWVEDIYKYDRFISEIKDIMKKSKVSIVKEKVDLEEDSVLWSFKVKRK